MTENEKRIKPEVSISEKQRAKIRRVKQMSAFKRGCFTAVLLLILGVTAVIILTPTVLTITNSFMSQTEITANYGKIFSNVGNGDKSYIADKVNLKLIPDKVSFRQYSTMLLTSPVYLMKFWNSVILTVPITVFQIVLALGAAYCFSRFKTKIRNGLFFMYIILMLMPYQVTLVPNYLVSDWLNILDTRWSILLPGIFAPFSVFILTKFMRRIPSSIIEAAKLDGAGEWQIFFRVCIPQSMGAIWSVAILVFIDYWNMVEQPIIMIKNSDLHPLSVFLSRINIADPGLAFAVAVIYMIPSLLIFFYGEDYLIEGIAYSGSLKG